MPSDDEVSLLSLSDGENDPGPARSNSGTKVSKGSSKQQDRTSAPASLSRSRSSTGGNKRSSNQHKARVSFHPVYEVDETEEDDDGDGEYGEYGHSMDDIEELFGAPGTAGGENPLANLSRKIALKQSALGPTKWAEVDETEIQEEAEALLSSVMRSALTEKELLNKLFQTAVIDDKELLDPLGMGALDLLSMKLVPKGTATSLRGPDGQISVAGKWRKSSSAGSLVDAADGAAGGSSSGAAASSKILAGLAHVLPSEEGFVPEAYLSTFHKGSSESELKKGMRVLNKELSERTGQLKQLIKDNFERFISCKSTIDDIYAKLQSLENDKKGGTSMDVLHKAIEQAQASARRTFGGVMERAAKTDRIKSVSNLLQRFNNLFGMPSRIKALALEGDLEQIVREYQRANALIRPSANTARVWVSLYQEIERRVTEVAAAAREALQDMRDGEALGPEEAPEYIIFLAQLAQEKLPAARDDDPMRVYLSTVERHMETVMQACDSQQQAEATRLRAQMLKAPTSAAARSLGVGASVSQGGAGQADTSGSNGSAVQAGGSSSGSRSASGAVDPLMLWAGPADWRPDLELPPRMAENLRRRLQPDMPRSQLLAESGVTPGQAMWLSYVSRLCEALVARLPTLWAVANSSKYAQASDLSGPPRESMSKAPSLARRMVDGIMQKASGRLQAALTALSSCGPLHTALELAVKELCWTWQQLREDGTTSKALDAVRTCAFAGLALYGQGAAVHLQALPAQLFEREDWQLHVTAQQQEPSTALPWRVQEEVSIAMFFYKRLAQACEEVDEVQAAAAWAPMQAGLFDCFSSFTQCVADFTADMRLRISKAAGSKAGSKERAAKRRGTRASADLDDAAPDADKLEDSSAADALLLLGAGALGDVDPQQDTFDVSDANPSGSSPSPSGHTTRVLLLLSGAGLVRSKVMPELLERYRPYLAGATRDGDARCDSGLKQCSAELRRALRSLMVLYLERKRAGLTALVGAYTRSAPALAAAGAELQQLSDGCNALVACLVDVYTEVIAYAPGSLHSIVSTLVEHVIGELASRFAELPSDMEVEAVLQLYCDLMYLDYVVHGFLPDQARDGLDQAYAALAARLLDARKRASARTAAPTRAVKALSGASSPSGADARARQLCKPVLQQMVERSAFNIRCFAAGRRSS